MSASLQWSIIRNNSSFLVKSLGNTFTKVCLKYQLLIWCGWINVQLDCIFLWQEPNNLTGKNAFKYNGLVNKKVYKYEFLAYSILLLLPVMRVVQGGLCHGSRAKKLTHHESQIFKFHLSFFMCHAKYLCHRLRRNFLWSHVSWQKLFDHASRKYPCTTLSNDSTIWDYVIDGWTVLVFFIWLQN